MPASSAQAGIEVTGGAGRWPIYDRLGRRIRVGDTLRAQVCVGRYGQTRVIVCVVTEAHWSYCQMTAADSGGTARVVSAELASNPTRLVCYNRHTDVEHAHETWAEIVG